jgi:predicted transcriptional regulator
MLNEAEDADITRLASLDMRSRSYVIRKAIHQYLASPEISKKLEKNAESS